MYDSESSSEAGWIEWFCDLEGHEFFIAVSNSFNDKQEKESEYSPYFYQYH